MTTNDAGDDPPLGLRPYADLFVGCRHVFEIGTGEGHFLAALVVRDIGVAGCEQDPQQAALARAAGLSVADGGLEQLATHVHAFDGIFVGHVAEHLTPPQLEVLLVTCRRALRSGGRLICRTRRNSAVTRTLRASTVTAGFGNVRQCNVPDDAEDAVTLALVGALSPPLDPPSTLSLASIALPTHDLPINQPMRSLFDLERFERRVFSQGGEDGVLAAIFACLGTTNRTYVEFGCGDGVQCNTANLRRQGWRGLLMDGVAVAGAEDAVVHRAWITADNIEALLDSHVVPDEPDLLSIDLDGNDYWVWRAIQRRPRVVVAEYNANLGPRVHSTIAYDPAHCWDGTDYYGASLAALAELAARKGYSLVYCNQAGVNAFFVRNDLMPDARRRPVTAIYRPPNYWYRGGRQVPDLSGRRFVDVSPVGDHELGHELVQERDCRRANSGAPALAQPI